MDTILATLPAAAAAPAAWWSCAGCPVEAELPVDATAGCVVPCPDCGHPMVEQWTWDAAA